MPVSPHPLHQPSATPRARRRLRTPVVLTATAALVAASLAGLYGVTRADAATAPYQDASQPVATRVADLLARMSLDDKVGQMTQADRAKLNASDITTYRLGSILSGGSSPPANDSATGWADTIDGYQRAALATPLGIPMIYGVDAVHGANGVSGATVYPHNIGLGATRNPSLVQKIGRATAEEVTGAGQDWTFAPCLCVARNDRWGRTYESYGENPEIATSMTTIVTGLQGDRLGGSASVLATAKHYVGDGGTTGGVDQGKTEISETELRAVHLPPFKAAVERGVGSVMLSYSSWNGTKMHGNKYLVTDVLKGELGFKGFVVSDWAGIDQLDGARGFSQAEVVSSINAGLDMVMVPDDYKTFIGYLKSAVTGGQIPMSRIDDAVTRILTKKFELGLFEKPLADRSYTSGVGSQAHRDLARQAVRESQVLLKNANAVLPLAKSGARYFVAGKNADDIGNQTGGWTMGWQGKSGNITAGTTILQGIRNAAGSSNVTYSRDGSGVDGSYKAAIAVVGETPYAEGAGDRTGSMSLDSTDLTTISRLRGAGIPVIVVLVSGRPLDVASEVGNWSALLAAWLPGTEGQGVADVLFGDYNPTGKLPVTWMQSASQQPINDGDGKTGLYPYGHGLRYPGGNPATDPSESPSASVSASVSVSSSPGPSPSGSSGSSSGGTRCTVAYKVTSQWAGGFVADVTVGAVGAAVDDWTLTFTFPGDQRVTSAWNATATQAGAAVTVRNAGWNGSIPPGGTVAFGFQGTAGTTNAAPTGFALNGTACG